jgi:hypothetical protein
VVTNILAIALQNKKVEGVHELRTRQSGMSYIIQMHLEMRDDMPLHEAHVIADTVELAIRKAYPNSDVIIHQDPVGIVDHGQAHFSDRVTKDDLDVSPITDSLESDARDHGLLHPEVPGHLEPRK